MQAGMGHGQSGRAPGLCGCAVTSDDDDLLFVLAETIIRILLYTRLGTPSRYRRKNKLLHRDCGWAVC
jgi:hypothetical protein